MSTDHQQPEQCIDEWSMLTMTPMQLAMHRISRRIDRAMSRRWGDRMPVWLVCEYPKSGGTWLARMLALCLRVPFCEFSLMPISSSCVTFSHWRYDPGRRRCYYIYRDGRDVLVSLFYHRMRIVHQHPSTPAGVRWARRHPYLLSDAHGQLDQIRLFRVFAADVLGDTAGGFDWARHVLEWQQADPARVKMIQYEQLLERTRDMVVECLRFSGRSCSEQQIDHAVGFFSFQAMSGREVGEEDRGAFVRKGIAGDWVNHFDRETAQHFQSHSGDALRKLGYIRDAGWVDVAESR